MADRVLGQETMKEERIIKDDGRYLIFYSFRPDGRAEQAPPAEGNPPVEGGQGGGANHV